MLSLLCEKNKYIYICDHTAGFKNRWHFSVSSLGRVEKVWNMFLIICDTAARGLYTPTTWEEWSDPSYMQAAREMAAEVEAYEREMKDDEEDGKWKLKYCRAKNDIENQLYNLNFITFASKR